MIHLSKGPAPVWLETNRDDLTNTYSTAPNDSKPAPWRAPVVLESLRAESYNKCIYCESIIDDVSYAAVEHIRPKSLFPELVLSWHNLGLVCQRCNTNKGNYWSESAELQLLDPFVDDASQHLEFVGPLIFPYQDSSRGINTIRKLKFDTRDDLVLSKMKRIQELERRIRLWKAELRSEYKKLLAEDIQDSLETTREYSASLKAFAILRGFDPYA